MSPRLEVIVGGSVDKKEIEDQFSALAYMAKDGGEGGQGNLCMLIDFLFSSPSFLEYFSFCFVLRKCLGNYFRNIYCKLIVCVCCKGGNWIGEIQVSETRMTFMCHSGIY